MARPLTTSQWIEQTLRERIANGSLSPGMHINEASLADELGISRGPLRESLRRLEIEGLVEYNTNRGCVVRSYTQDSLWEIATLRSVLEQYAVHLATLRDRAGLTCVLAEKLRLMRQFAHQGDWQAVTYGDLAFHEALVHHSQHQLLIKHWTMIAQPVFHFIRLQPQNDEELVELAEGHDSIVSTIASGANAATVIDRHIMDALALIVQRHFLNENWPNKA